MRIPEKEYGEMVKKATPPSPMGKNLLLAFLVGGAISALGQWICTVYKSAGLEQETASLLTTVTMVFLGAFFTGINVYDKLAKHAGAGTIVPITGFANSIVSPAMEFKSEGFIFGTAAKMFTIAGPVIVYGVSSSVVYGLVYWVTALL